MKALLVFVAAFFGVQLFVFSLSPAVVGWLGMSVFVLAIVGVWKWMNK